MVSSITRRSGLFDGQRTGKAQDPTEFAGPVVVGGLWRIQVVSTIHCPATITTITTTWRWCRYLIHTPSLLNLLTLAMHGGGRGLCKGLRTGTKREAATMIRLLRTRSVEHLNQASQTPLPVCRMSNCNSTFPAIGGTVGLVNIGGELFR